MRDVVDSNRHLLRARDVIDRCYAEPLDIVALAAVAHVSPAHFIRSFRATFGETPHRFLQRRRIERACALLRDTDLTVAQVCTEVGFTSVSTFVRTFTRVVGENPSAHRARPGTAGLPTCAVKAWLRPA